MRIRRYAAPALAALVTLSLQATPAQAQAFPQLPNFGSSLPALPALPAVPGVPSSSQGAPVQQVLLAETNRYRLSKGLPPLAAHDALNNVAQSWSESMAQQGNLRHNPGYRDSYPATWRQAAENVGMFSREVAAHEMLQAWINSPTHRQHLDNPNFTHVGIGWAISPRGEVYATQNFARF
ncbi:CAP domain-containing protein [Corynebacterium nasicanis]|uniref:CAP domain-containing protein n=1 Tax=Corynebacterium nasicanis TaxID=1448267 RepID=A0ABW1QEB6_9CORY